MSKFIIVFAIGVVLVVSLNIYVLAAAYKIARENRPIANVCQKTDLYFIRNNGIKTRVYDCSGHQLD